MQFADNIMIFCDANVSQLGLLRCLLRCFEAMSGLNINLAKSEMFPVGMVPNIDRMAWILGCKIGSLSSMHLGLPLGAPHKSKLVWEPVIERIGYRLEAWKAALLSKGGRLTLLKSTLAPIPSYFLSLLIILASVANRIERMFRNFLWNDSDSHHRYHLVDWKSICKLLCYRGAWGEID